jgi:hypothetical protein
MNSRLILWLCLFGLFGSLVATAADVTGKWTAQVPARGGEMRDTTFMFKQEGSQLTGTMAMSGRERDSQIEEGKVDGDNISFTVTLSLGGGDMKFFYKGVVSGNEIKFTREREGSGQLREFTAKRADS